MPLHRRPALHDPDPDEGRYQTAGFLHLLALDVAGYSIVCSESSAWTSGRTNRRT